LLSQPESSYGAAVRSEDRKLKERLIGLALVLILAAIYLESPRRVFLDSRFALLTAESLLEHQSFDLGPYMPWQIAKVEATPEGARPRIPYQIRDVNGRLVYLYPAGSSVLSIPVMAVLRLFGESSINAEGYYTADGERSAQALLASLLAAFTGLLVFRSALRELPPAQAGALGLVIGLGTGLWSVASRMLWSHSWATLLAAGVWLEMQRWDEGRAPRPVLVGALLSAAFWVRPTGAALVVPVTVYVFLRYRPMFVRLLATGLVGILTYVGLTYSAWGGLHPPYLGAVRGFTKRPNVLAGIAGMLVSPGRGLFVYSPFLLLTAWLLARHGVPRPRRPLLWLALAIFGSYVLLYTTWHSWWGFGQVGPRFLCEVTPALAWLCALAWRRAREFDATRPRPRPAAMLRASSAGLLVAAALAAHAPLALSGGLRLPSKNEVKARREAYGTHEIPPYWRIQSVPQGRLLEMYGIDPGWGLAAVPDDDDEE